MTKRTRNGRKRSCKTLCLAFPFFSIGNFCLTKKEKRKLLPFAKVFPLQIKCFLIFAKVFYAKFVPKVNIRESFCQKFRESFSSRKFLPLKYLQGNETPWGLSFACCSKSCKWNVSPIPRNLTCPEKFLVARLKWRLSLVFLLHSFNWRIFKMKLLACRNQYTYSRVSIWLLEVFQKI